MQAIFFDNYEQDILKPIHLFNRIKKQSYNHLSPLNLCWQLPSQDDVGLISQAKDITSLEAHRAIYIDFDTQQLHIHPYIYYKKPPIAVLRYVFHAAYREFEMTNAFYRKQKETEEIPYQEVGKPWLNKHGFYI